MATESSVVVALKEVRRLELERQRREEETRRADEERARSEASSVQYGPGMVPFGNGWGNGEGLPEGFSRNVHRTSEVMTVQGQDFAHPQSYVGFGSPVAGVGQPPSWEGPSFPSQKRKSSFKAVLATLVLCSAGAAAGLWKMNSDFASKLSLIEAQRQKTEEVRNEAVAARAKAEQELKLKIAEYEGKLGTANAKATAASTALAVAARASASAPAAAAPAPLPTARGLRRPRGWGRAKAPVAAAPALPKAPPPAPAPAAPKVAKKKAVTDDPLGGLRL